MRKIFIALVTLLCISCTAFLMTACEVDLSNLEPSKSEIQLVYNNYVTYSNQNGHTPISYDEWLTIMKGDKSEVDVSIESVETDSNDNFLIKFTQFRK